MHDGFDTSMIEIRNEDYKMFIEELADLNNKRKYDWWKAEAES